MVSSLVYVALLVFIACTGTLYTQKKRETKKRETYNNLARQRIPDAHTEVLDSTQLVLFQALRNGLMHCVMFSSREMWLWPHGFIRGELTLPPDSLDDKVIATCFVRKAEQIVCAMLVKDFNYPECTLRWANEQLRCAQLDIPSR